jgi:hypothetical protein
MVFISFSMLSSMLNGVHARHRNGVLHIQLRLPTNPWDANVAPRSTVT